MAVTYAIPRNYTPRQKNWPNHAHEVINYDGDNAYPQRIFEVLMGSSTGVACSNIYAKFIGGNGFSDEAIGELIINAKGQTVNQLLAIISRDYAIFKTFAIHVNYNLNYEISGMTRIDPRYVRLGIPDTNEYIAKVGVYNDWARDNYKIIKRKEIDYIDVYNPNPEAVRKQIERDGGISKYKGQVLYYTGDEQGYPRCPHDSVLNDLEVDAKISVHSLAELDKGFMAKHILFLPFEFASDEERQSFKAGLTGVEGADGNSIFVVEAALSKEDQQPELKPVDHTFTDLRFESTQEMVRQKIYRAYGQPGILHTDHKDSGLSSSDQIETAFNFYNQHTVDERIMMQNTFYDLLTRFFVKIDGLDDIDILERRFEAKKKDIGEEFLKDLTKNERRQLIGFEALEDEEAKNEKNLLIDSLGVGGTQALLSVLSGELGQFMPDEQKIKVLETVFGLEPSEAAELVKTGLDQTKNKPDEGKIIEQNADIPN